MVSRARQFVSVADAEPLTSKPCEPPAVAMPLYVGLPASMRMPELDTPVIEKPVVAAVAVAER